MTRYKNKNKYDINNALLNVRKNIFSLTTKQITYGAIFAASSVAIVIILMTFTPILAFPNVRISFEGILIKISGYLFGPIIGCLTGIISELLINTLRPVFFNIPYTLIIIFYGIFGGFVKILNAKAKRPELLFFIISTVLIFSFVFFFLFFINSQHTSMTHPFIIFGIKFYSVKILNIVVISLEAIVFLTLPILKVITFIVFKKGQNFYYEILPIYMLAIFTSFSLTIPLASWGDSQLFLNHVAGGRTGAYLNALLVEIAITPMNIFTNMVVIYFVWKIINIFIYNQQLGKYSKNTMDIELKSNPFERLCLETKNNNSIKKPKFTKIKTIQRLSNINFFKNKIVIGITGTNGKGTIGNFIYHYLIKKEYNSGLFSSPHILKWNERIKFNWKAISDQQFSQIYSKIRKYISLYKLSTYESLLLASLFYFHQKNAKIIILECGIGAKNDIVAQIKNNYSVITNISIDHTDILGSTLNKIAKNKSYIIKNRSKCFIYEKSKTIQNIYKKRVKKLSKVKLMNVLNKKNSIIKKRKGFLITVNNDSILYNDPFYFNAKNILTAATLANEITNEGIINIISKMKNIKFFGRNTITTFQNNNYVFNVAHNYESIKEVIKSYKLEKLPACAFILSFSVNKEINKILQLFSKKNDSVFLCKNSSENSFLPENFKINPKIKIINNVEKWIKNNKEYKNVCCVGSFSLISDLIKFFNKEKG